jgi:hypothetical protein
MKANLYNETEQPIEALNEHNQALADQKPAPVDAPTVEPKRDLYIINYKTLVTPTIVALLILAVWALATWLL